MIWLIIVILCVIISFQFFYIRNTKNQLKEISNALDDVVNGNLDRRFLANEDSAISELVYKINDIIIQNKNKFLETDKSEKAYKKLVTSLSHDIRTPLSSLIGYLEVLENNSCSQEEQKKFLKIAKNKAIILGEYIQSLFQWLKLESGEWIYNFEKENICELTRVILTDWIIRLEENNIKFEFDIPEEALYLVTDKNVYERIINNILSNIIKHSEANFLSFKLSLNHSDIVIEITDNGVGISEQDLPFIFNRLYKCDSSRTENSNGLGLAITKELTSAIGGTIYAKSKLNKGTTFVLNFHINMNKE
ncbi:sensor histidine kinase [Clostridium tertium]|uniref:histidine kinase n=1 Tax=Clostridium tertium TaxID=1559 RepID=A0A6N3GTP9_9CLOT